MSNVQRRRRTVFDPVLIVCDSCAEPTRHTFLRHGRVGEYGAYEQIYGCSRCNAPRRYGLSMGAPD